jgi:amino acid transporter
MDMRPAWDAIGDRIMTNVVTTADISRSGDGAGKKGLKKNYLSFPDVLSQSIGTIAPSGTPGLVIPVVFATAANGTWLAYGFATIALLIVALQINVFASRVSTPGSLYVYAGIGLGPLAGIISGWALLIGYIFTAGAVILGTVNTSLAVFHIAGLTTADIGLTYGISIVAAVVAWWLAYRDIKLSTRTSLLFEFVTVALILLAVFGYFAVHGGYNDPQQIHLQDVNFDQLRLGLVLAFFSFVGFESATVLGVEAKQPRVLIPRAVIWSVVSVGVLFVVSSLALVAGFRGVDPGLATADAPLTVLAASFGVRPVGVIISIGFALSFFACVLASINAASRVLFSLSHHGVFHAAAQGTHERNETPHIAIAIVTIIALGLALGLTIGGWGILDAYGILGSIATYGFLFSYVLVSIRAPIYLKRHGLLKGHNVLSAIVAVALLALVVFGTVYPVPGWPYNILPYIFLAFLAVGAGYFLILRKTDPARLAAIETDLLGLPPEALK